MVWGIGLRRLGCGCGRRLVTGSCVICETTPTGRPRSRPRVSLSIYLSILSFYEYLPNIGSRFGTIWHDFAAPNDFRSCRRSMATMAMPQTAPPVDPHPTASEPWREEESDRFYAELDNLPLPFGDTSNEQKDQWAPLTSALPHRSQREVVAFAHAEYHRMYTDPKHAQLLQDFPLGLWSAQALSPHTHTPKGARTLARTQARSHVRTLHARTRARAVVHLLLAGTGRLRFRGGPQQRGGGGGGGGGGD